MPYIFKIQIENREFHLKEQLIISKRLCISVLDHLFSDIND